ncbi:hypothetical protein Mapa_012893 [Marchantia paleacea]|nr:hypothetical protein Mapa_012893 [Marchantia paleacea]
MKFFPLEKNFNGKEYQTNSKGQSPNPQVGLAHRASQNRLDGFPEVDVFTSQDHSSPIEKTMSNSQRLEFARYSNKD